MKMYENQNIESFKEWVVGHNPELNWNFDDPESIQRQLNRTIKESGNLQLKELFKIMFYSCSHEIGLTPGQMSKFLTEDY